MAKKHRTTHGRPAATLTRRHVLDSAASATSLALIPVAPHGAAAAEEPPRVLAGSGERTLNALVDRLVPADGNGPGAVEAGVPVYINRSLAEWNSAEREFIENGLRALDETARQRHGSAFAELDGQRRDDLLVAMEADQLDGVAEAGALFGRLRRLTLEGMFSDPYYGGNRDYIGWDLIGYPGAVTASTPAMQRMGERLQPLHTSAYGEEYDGD